jgi:hypothetical protein
MSGLKISIYKQIGNFVLIPDLSSDFSRKFFVLKKEFRRILAVGTFCFGRI